MTKDELKEKLSAYRDLEAERVQIRQELTRLEGVMYAPKGANMDGMPRSPGAGDPVLAVVSQHMILRERYLVQLGRLADAQTDIENLIEGLDPVARKLMRHRYIDGLPWEAVCVAVGYGWRQTHNIHSAALDKILERYSVEGGA